MIKIKKYLWQICVLVLASTLFVNVHAESFEKLLMPGKVITGHAKYENECAKCHDVLEKNKQRTLCLDCHEDVQSDVSRKQGYHGRHKTARQANCKTCHVEHEGRNADIIKLDQRTFRHELTDFKLKGAHRVLKCNQCHDEKKKYRDTPAQCHTCHKKNPHDGKLGNKCSSCHSQVLWSDLSFDHDKTKFALKGRHKNTGCNSCHINQKYKDTPKTCYSCHSVDDVHAGRNGKECGKCHDTVKWGKLSFDHNKKTKFKLYGRHKEVSCKSCHPKNPYKVKIKQDCYSCHKSDDIHNGQYEKKCQTCHGFKKWSKSKFDHDKDTKYRLTGRHKKAQCVSCHKGNIYKDKTPSKCIDCHKVDNVHKGKNIDQCSECHSTSGWAKRISFDHDMSEFPLIGLHALTACDDCHLSSAHKTTPDKCNDCHRVDDVHKSKLGIKCESCHNPNGWKYWQFDHDKDTGFKLTGVHKKLHCYDCHDHAVEVVQTGSSCGSCHQGDDPHNNQFGRQCEQCHDTESFMHIKMLLR